MTGHNHKIWRKALHIGLAGLLALTTLFSVVPAQAATERALYLYYTHTGETARIVFKRNGQYVQSGLNELNRFLRDWRRNEPTKMDPRLFDLVWEVYQDVGATQPINVVSAYRSPQTNAMLAAQSSGVADNSQHMRGHAMDFFIPGIPLAKLRATAMKKQVGGVGYYPTSGSPFVHLDTGSVRAWPRMTRNQLAELFPDGKTMHLPTDGKPLSQQGYQVALAEWKQCHSFPCNGSSSGTQVASNGGGGRSLVDMIFGGGNQPAAASAAIAAPAVQAAALPAATGPVAPVMPVLRPADLGGPAPAAMAVAAVQETAIPFSTTGSAPLTEAELGRAQVAVTMPVSMPVDLRSGDAVTAIAAIAPTMPTPRVLMTNPPAETLSAYLPANAPDPGAQQALETLLQQSGAAGAARVAAAPAPSASLPVLPPLTTPTGLRTASLGGQPADALGGLFTQTFQAASSSSAPTPLAQALQQHVAARPQPGAMRDRDLVPPDLEHVADIFTAPAQLTSTHFAVIFDHDEADFDPTPEMGRYVLVKGIGNDQPAMGHSRFTPVAPLAAAGS